VLSNDVGGAINYVNANSYSGEEYTLLIGASNVTVAVSQTLNAANAKLTIIGIGAERFITSTTSHRLFIINGNNTTNLTLGQNITLRTSGSLGGGDMITDKLVSVLRGSVSMRGGSKITEARFGAVFVDGINAGFKMEGGEIIAPPYSNIYSAFSNVYVRGGGTFEMNSGSITGGTQAEDMYIAPDGIFRLSGNARIGTLILYANNATTRASITIVGNYSGTVNRLHLRGNDIFASNVVVWWTNVPVIVNGTAGVISMFNNGLGDFLGMYDGSGTPIGVTHELNANGFLVLKEN
jgi:hypothetical protein